MRPTFARSRLPGAALAALPALLAAPPAWAAAADPAGAAPILGFLGHPAVAPFLLTLGVLGLLLELKTPTFGMAGLAGVASFVLFFAAQHALGRAGWDTFLLLGVAVVLLAVEVLLLPGFGVPGAAGLAAFLGAVVTAMVGPEPAPADLWLALAVLVAAITMAAFSVWALVTHLPATDRGRELLAHYRLRRDAGYVAVRPRSDLVGAEGVAVTDLRPAGTAAFGEERLDVVAERGFVTAGTRVRLVRSEGYRHVVEAVPGA